MKHVKNRKRAIAGPVFDTLEDRRMLCMLALNPFPMGDDVPPVDGNPELILQNPQLIDSPDVSILQYIDPDSSIDNPCIDMLFAQDDYYGANVDQSLVVSPDEGLLANDFNPDGLPLTVTLLDSPYYGNLLLNDDGSFTYTPGTEWTDFDSFSYVVSDGQNTSEPAWVEINIYNPIQPCEDSYRAIINQPLSVGAEEGLLANDFNDTGNELALSLVEAPQNGELILNADGSFSYAPFEDFSGDDYFTYTLTDGERDSGLVYVYLYVSQPIEACDDWYARTMDQPVVIDAEYGLLSNDFNFLGDEMTVSLVDAPENGRVFLNADGSFLYIPDAGACDADFFTYVIDGTDCVATVYLDQVYYDTTGGDDPSEGEESADYVTDEDSNYTFEDETLFEDGEEPIFLDEPFHGRIIENEDGTLTYIPDENYNGKDFLVYSMGGQIHYRTLQVSAVNDAPKGRNRAFSRSPESPVAINPVRLFSDADNDELSYSIANQPQHGTAILNDNGTPDDSSDDFIEYIPDEGYYGEDVLTLSCSDGAAETTSLVTVQTRRVGLRANLKNANKTDLIVLGTKGDDLIKLLSDKKGKVKVILNGESQGLFNPTAKIIVKGLEGDDVIDAGKLNKIASLFGNQGDDRLLGSLTRASKLNGGAGNDAMKAAINKNTLFNGGKGKNHIGYYRPVILGWN